MERVQERVKYLKLKAWSQSQIEIRSININYSLYQGTIYFSLAPIFLILWIGYAIPNDPSFIIQSMSKNSAIYIPSGNPASQASVHNYAESCELYQLFSEMSRIVARKSQLNPSQVVGEYLGQCNKGEHVVLKSYSSFSKSVINRQCFLYNFCKIFETETNVRNGLDYYQLFRLLCSDFPKDIVVNAVRMVEGAGDKMMEALLNSEKFLNALYISFMYFEYLESMQKLFKNSYSQQIALVDIFSWVRGEDKRNPRNLEKPPLQILLQILLNYLAGKNAIRVKGITFLNNEDIEDFISSCAGENSKTPIGMSYEVLLGWLLENKKHQKLVDKNIFCFDNSSNWVNEACKILNVKDAENPQPLNSKKMKKK